MTNGSDARARPLATQSSLYAFVSRAPTRAVHVLRGRAGDVDADRAVTRRLVTEAGEVGEPALRVWYPHRQVAFGRRDARSEGYPAARRHAEQRGFAPIERGVGGRATAYIGAGSTLAFARAEPVADARSGLTERYERTLDVLREALDGLGVEARRGEPPDSFCPGDHSLQAAGKLVGLAQRVRQDVALVAGILNVRDHGAVAAVLEPVYDALDVPFDPESVGSVARAGGGTDPERVQERVEAALVGGRTARVTPVAAYEGRRDDG